MPIGFFWECILKERNHIKHTTKDICFAAVAVALICVCSWIAVPIGGVPVTLQSLAVFLTAVLLGVKRSFFAIIAYLVLGFIGVPVFAGFTGGFGKLLSPTGGYLLAFLLVTPLIALFFQRKQPTFWRLVAVFSVATLVLHILGMLWLVFLAQNTSVSGWWSAWAVCVLPCVLPDICKIFLGAVLAVQLQGKID